MTLFNPDQGRGNNIRGVVVGPYGAICICASKIARSNGRPPNGSITIVPYVIVEPIITGLIKAILTYT